MVSSSTDIYSQGIACLKDPKMSGELIQALVYERKVKIDVPGFTNTRLIIRPLDKQFRENLKSFAKEHKDHSISELEKNYLMRAFLYEIRDHRAIYRMKQHHLSKQEKKYFIPKEASPELVQKKAAKHEVKFLDPETQKKISHQASLVLEEVSQNIKLLEKEKSDETETGGEPKETVTHEKVISKDHVSIVPPTKSKTALLFKEAHERQREKRPDAQELAVEEAAYTKERKRHEKEIETLEKSSSILKSEIAKQTHRREK